MVQLSEFHRDNNFILCSDCHQTRVIGSDNLPLCYVCKQKDAVIQYHPCNECGMEIDEMALDTEDLCPDCSPEARALLAVDLMEDTFG